MLAGMTKATRISFRHVKIRHRFPVHSLHRLHHHLCNPVPMMYDLLFTGKINQDHFDLSPVIRINRSRCVQTSDALFHRQTAARPHLRLIPIW